MKKLIVLFVLITSCVCLCSAQRFIVDSRKGSEKFAMVKKTDGEWKNVEPLKQVVLPTGYEFESINGDDYPLVFEYEGHTYAATKYHTSNVKTVKLLDSQGKDVKDIKKYKGNTVFGKFYFSTKAGYLALACGGLAFLFMVISMLIWVNREKGCPAFFRWAFAVPLAAVGLIELIALFTVGKEAYWWVNPDSVGYFLAIFWLFPYSIIVLMQCGAIWIYRFLIPEDKENSILDNILLVIMGIGMVVAVIGFIQVILEFVVAVFYMIFLCFLAAPVSGAVYKDREGRKYVQTGLGKQRVD